MRSARPLFINPSGDCPLWPSPSERAYSELAERLRTSPARSSTEPDLTPSGPGATRGRISFGTHPRNPQTLLHLSIECEGGVRVSTDVLTVEQAFYKESREALLKDHPGKWALIVERKLVGIFDSPDTAYAEGLKAVGNVPMLVIQILPEQPTVRFPALQLGLVSARL